MKKIIIFILLVFISFQTTFAYNDIFNINQHFFDPAYIETKHIIPKKIGDSIGPVLYAKSAIAIDYDTGILLYDKNINKKTYVASLTKLVTALTVLRYFDIQKRIKIPRAVLEIPPSKIHLYPDDEIFIKDLLYSILIHSANDSAYVLANMDEDFISKMNYIIKLLGLSNSNFTNAIGWDEDDNYSTAYDIAHIFRFLYQIELVQDILIQKEHIFYGRYGQKYTSTTRNQLFNTFVKTLGGKTGTTELAGQSFVQIYKTKNGNKVITVVLNSTDRFYDTKVLSHWIDVNYEWK